MRCNGAHVNTCEECLGIYFITYDKMLPSLPFSFYIIYTYIEHIYLLPTSTSHTHDIMSCTRLNPMCIVWRAEEKKNSNKHGYRFTIMTQLNESKFIKFVYNFHVLIADVDSSRSSSSSKCACNIQPINVSFSDTHHTLKIETKYGKNAQSGFVRSLLLSIHPSIHPLFYFISILFVCFAYAHTHSAISLVAATAAAAAPSTRRTYPHNAKYTCENSERPKNGIYTLKKDDFDFLFLVKCVLP